MIIISDAHINESAGNDIEFFQMLNALENTNENIVFLGDIFDLWIALPRYENTLHAQFLTWCNTQKKNRQIGFIEGNHEYYLAEERQQFFTWCSDKSCHRDGNGHLFCHGDQINRMDRNYLMFRKITKNRIMKTILCFIPLGPKLVEKVKAKLKLTNQEFRHSFPKGELEKFARSCFLSDIKLIFVGHFHQSFQFNRPEGRRLYTVPSWFGTGTITHFEDRSGKVRHCGWPELFE